MRVIRTTRKQFPDIVSDFEGHITSLIEELTKRFVHTDQMDEALFCLRMRSLFLAGMEELQGLLHDDEIE